MRNSALTCLFLLLLLPLAATAAAAGPSFFSLKHDKVHLRTGPGSRFPIHWVYGEQGYPVEVIDSFELWRQIREADGTIGWVHQNMLSSTRTALVQEEDYLTDKPTVGGRPVALVQQGTIGKIIRCPADSDYCLLLFRQEAKEAKGWYPRKHLWGLAPHEEID